MKAYFIYIYFGLLCITANANTQYYFRFEIQQQHTSQQDSCFIFEMHFYNKNAEWTDTFSVFGNKIFEKRYIVADSLVFSDLYFKVYNKKYELLRYYECETYLDVYRCGGHSIPGPFSGSSCGDLADLGFGKLCGNIEFQFTKKEYKKLIKTNWTDSALLYGSQGWNADGGRMGVEADCDFFYGHKSDRVIWQYSENKLNWNIIDSGAVFYPDLLSKILAHCFNRKYYFRALIAHPLLTTDTFIYTEISGPVSYFTYAKKDSLIFYPNRRCNEKNRLILYRNPKYQYKTDTPVAALWFVSEKGDSMKHSDFFLGSPGFDLISNRIDGSKEHAIDYRKGKYFIEVNYTPRAGIHGLIEKDTFIANDSDSGYYQVQSTLLSEIKCHGDPTAVLKCMIRSSDTAHFMISYHGEDWFDSSHLFERLSAGKYLFQIKRSDGCVYREKIAITEPDRFCPEIHADTIICNGQKASISLDDSNLNSAKWYQNGSLLSDDHEFETESSGLYVLERANSDGCVVIDSIRIKHLDVNIHHDFLIPAEALVSDTVYAVSICKPLPDRALWTCEQQIPDSVNKQTRAFHFGDTGKYSVVFTGEYGNCTFRKEKTISIIDDSATNKKTLVNKKNKVLREFHIYPNPASGNNFNVFIETSDSVRISLTKTGLIQNSVYEKMEFVIDGKYDEKLQWQTAWKPGVYFLRISNGAESLNCKVVVTE